MKNFLTASLLVLLMTPVGVFAQSPSSWYSTYSNTYNIQTGATLQPGTGPAQTSFKNGTINYVPLEPISSDPYSSLGYGGGGGTFATYLSSVFKLLLTLGSIFAVLMLVYGGVTYMTSGVSDTLQVAKKRMTSALWGLALLAGAWLILYTINPQLLQFNLNPQAINQSTQTLGTTGVQQTGSQTGSATKTTIDIQKYQNLDAFKANCESKGMTARPVSNNPDGTSNYVCQ